MEICNRLLNISPHGINRKTWQIPDSDSGSQRHKQRTATQRGRWVRLPVQVIPPRGLRHTSRRSQQSTRCGRTRLRERTTICVRHSRQPVGDLIPGRFNQANAPFDFDAPIFGLDTESQEIVIRLAAGRAELDCPWHKRSHHVAILHWGMMLLVLQVKRLGLSVIRAVKNFSRRSETTSQHDSTT